MPISEISHARRLRNWNRVNTSSKNKILKQVPRAVLPNKTSTSQLSLSKPETAPASIAEIKPEIDSLEGNAQRPRRREQLTENYWAQCLSRTFSLSSGSSCDCSIVEPHSRAAFSPIKLVSEKAGRSNANPDAGCPPVYAPARRAFPPIFPMERSLLSAAVFPGDRRAEAKRAICSPATGIL